MPLTIRSIVAAIERFRPQERHRPHTWFLEKIAGGARYPAKAIWASARRLRAAEHNTSEAIRDFGRLRAELNNTGYRLIHVPGGVDRGENDHALENEQFERTATFRVRNMAIIARRKAMDDYTCQACYFQLQVDGSYIIDCHHINPLGADDDVRITDIADLICLCPTCHRIAHTASPPLTVDQIRECLDIAEN